MLPSCRRNGKDCTITKDDFQGTESEFPSQSSTASSCFRRSKSDLNLSAILTLKEDMKREVRARDRGSWGT